MIPLEDYEEEEILRESYTPEERDIVLNSQLSPEAIGEPQVMAPEVMAPTVTTPTFSPTSNLTEDDSTRIEELRALLKGEKPDSPLLKVIKGIAPAIMGGLMGGKELSQVGGTLGAINMAKEQEEETASKKLTREAAKEELKQIFADRKEERKEERRLKEREEDLKYRDIDDKRADESLAAREEANKIAREALLKDRETKLTDSAQTYVEKGFEEDRPRFTGAVVIKPNVKLTDKEKNRFNKFESIRDRALAFKQAVESGDEDAQRANLSALGAEVKEMNNLGAALTKAEIQYLSPILPALGFGTAVKSLSWDALSESIAQNLLGADSLKKADSFLGFITKAHDRALGESGYLYGDESASILGLKKASNGKYVADENLSREMVKADYFLGRNREDRVLDHFKAEAQSYPSEKEAKIYLAKIYMATQTYDRPKLRRVLNPLFKEYGVLKGE